MSSRQSRLPMATPQFTVLFDAEGRATVFFKGEPIRNVRMVDFSTTMTVHDPVRSRISIELVGETIPTITPPAPEDPAA